VWAKRYVIGEHPPFPAFGRLKNFELEESASNSNNLIED
jgi:hypothetical protein